MDTPAAPRLVARQPAPPLTLRTLRGTSLQVPVPGRVIHLQFRRFAGCPICNLHLRSVARRIGEIESAGVYEVAVFHSTEDSMRPFQGDLPFDIVADPARVAYAAYGVGHSVRSILDPRAWGAFVRGVAARHPSSSRTGEGGHTGLPADFLLARDGTVAAVKYGAHADDQWSVDELLGLAATM